jgi:hypothetical protein
VAEGYGAIPVSFGRFGHSEQRRTRAAMIIAVSAASIPR